jgi:hypothetical protein
MHTTDICTCDHAGAYHNGDGCYFPVPADLVAQTAGYDPERASGDLCACEAFVQKTVTVEQVRRDPDSGRVVTDDKGELVMDKVEAPVSIASAVREVRNDLREWAGFSHEASQADQALREAGVDPAEPDYPEAMAGVDTPAPVGASGTTEVKTEKGTSKVTGGQSKGL